MGGLTGAQRPGSGHGGQEERKEMGQFFSLHSFEMYVLNGRKVFLLTKSGVPEEIPP